MRVLCALFCFLPTLNWKETLCRDLTGKLRFSNLISERWTKERVCVWTLVLCGAELLVASRDLGIQAAEQGFWMDNLH